MSEDQIVRVEQGAKRVRAYLGASWWPTPDDPCSVRNPTIGLYLPLATWWRTDDTGERYHSRAEATRPRLDVVAGAQRARRRSTKATRPSRRARCRADRVGRHGRVAGRGRAVYTHPGARTRAWTSWRAAAMSLSSSTGTRSPIRTAEDPLRDRAAPRYYLPLTTCRGAPAASSTVTHCPTRVGNLLSIELGGTLHEDWSGSTGAACLRVRRSPACLLLQREGRLTVDGERLERPRTSSAERRCPRHPVEDDHGHRTTARRRARVRHRAARTWYTSSSPAAGQPPDDDARRWKVWNLDGAGLLRPSRAGRTAQSRRSDLAVHIAELEA